jgi:beta-galactosidase/evolved beta-galactosidase subunit alpha
MYTNHEKLSALGVQNLPKPHILCEYAHSMGNGPGGLEDYWDIFWAYPRLQGGFLWEWRDHTIRRKGAGGRDEICYGGDFGDLPNNGDFCADGLTLGDGTLSPAMAQVKHVLSPIRGTELDIKDSRVRIWNRNDFLAAGIYVMGWEYAVDGELIRKGLMDLPPIPPGEQRWISLPASIAELKPETVTLRFFPRESAPEQNSAPNAAEEMKAELDVSQFLLPENEKPRLFSLPEAGERVSLEEGKGSLSLRSAGTVLAFSTAHGSPEYYVRENRFLLKGRLEMCFYRSPLQNDRNQAPMWEQFMVPYLQPCLLSLETEEGERFAEVRVRKRYAPYTMNWFIEAELAYRMGSDGSFTLKVRGDVQGKAPSTLPRIGFYGCMPGGLENIYWYGRGPGECYRDSKAGSPLGRYHSTVDALHFPYAVPQENGNRTDVRWVSFTGADGFGLRVEARETLNFTAHHYTLEDCIRAKHDSELPRREDIWFHLDHCHHGLGAASWGPDALPQHRLEPGPFSFEWRLLPLGFRG